MIVTWSIFILWKWCMLIEEPVLKWFYEKECQCPQTLIHIWVALMHVSSSSTVWSWNLTWVVKKGLSIPVSMKRHSLEHPKSKTLMEAHMRRYLILNWFLYSIFRCGINSFWSEKQKKIFIVHQNAMRKICSFFLNFKTTKCIIFSPNPFFFLLFT